MLDKMSLGNVGIMFTNHTGGYCSHADSGMDLENGEDSYRRFREYGDESGLIEIIRDYKDGLILFLSKIVGDVLMAEELAEDTFVLLGTKKPKDKGKGSFKTWLYTMGRNLAIDYLRKKARRPELLYGNNDAFDALDSPQHLGYEDNLIEENYIRKERDISIHHAMRRLKPDYRQILWLIYFDDLSHKECARIMKKSVHAVETLVYRARIALREELETEGISYEDI